MKKFLLRSYNRQINITRHSVNQVFKFFFSYSYVTSRVDEVFHADYKSDICSYQLFHISHDLPCSNAIHESGWFYAFIVEASVWWISTRVGFWNILSLWNYYFFSARAIKKNDTFHREGKGNFRKKRIRTVPGKSTRNISVSIL